MIDAEIKNKLPEIENREDVLTSNVFGLLSLMNYNYILEVISTAKNYKGVSLKEKLQSKNIIKVELWKNFLKIGEPDIFIELDDGTFFIIEVKYFSKGEHNRKIENDSDSEKQENGQLAKYLDIEINSKKSDFIVYLTADYQSLKKIKESNSSSKNILSNIYYIHWNEVNECLIKLQNLQGIEQKIVEKIITYLDYKGFTYWKGFDFNQAYNIKISTRGFYER